MDQHSAQLTTQSNSAHRYTTVRQDPVLMSPLIVSSTVQSGTDQQSSTFPSSSCVTDQQSSVSMPLPAVPSIHGSVSQQSSTEFVPSSTSVPSNRASEIHHSPDQSYAWIDFATLQGFYNREQAAVEYSRMHARYGNHLLSQLNFWKQAFTNLQAAYVQLQADHTALLTRYELAISHNIDAGPVIIENMALKRKLTHLEHFEDRYQNQTMRPAQDAGFANTRDVTPIEEDSDYSDYSDYCPEDNFGGEAF